MAALNCVLQTAAIALTAATAKTVALLTAATNQRVRVIGWGVFFDSTSGSAQPVQVEILRFDATSAGTSTTQAPVKMDESLGETVQTAGNVNYTAEPTVAGNIVDSIECHPQQGYEKLLPPGQEIIVKGGGKLAIRCNAPAGVDVRAKIIFEE